jgi:hypothetical protein
MELFIPKTTAGLGIVLGASLIGMDLCSKAGRRDLLVQSFLS